MKVVILAGGYGTRISEESHLKPKPMIEIGDKPIMGLTNLLYAADTGSILSRNGLRTIIYTIVTLPSILRPITA